MLRRGAVALLRRGLRQAAEESAASWSAAKAVQGSRPPVMQQARQQWTDRRGYEHFGGRGGYAVMQPQTSRRTVTWVVVLGAGGGVVWYSGRQEVPYTGRWHSILISPEAEKEMGAEAFQQVCAATCCDLLASPGPPALLSVFFSCQPLPHNYIALLTCLASACLCRWCKRRKPTARCCRSTTQPPSRCGGWGCASRSRRLTVLGADIKTTSRA